MRKVILSLIIILSELPLLFGQSSGTGANFLKIPVGPRAVGLGSAFTGVGDDIYTIYWNPAGIGFIRRWEMSAMYNRYFADMYNIALSGVKQYRMLGSKKTAFGLGLFYHGMPDWNSTNDPNASTASASNVLGIISFGQRLDWLLKNISVGVNAKLGYSELMTHSATTLAADLGIMVRMSVWNKPLSLGLTAQHIGYQSEFINVKSPLPQGFRLGASYRILGCPWHHVLIATDISKYKYADLKVGFGAEYWLREILGIRAGYNYNQDDLGDISFGASVRLDAFHSGIQADYAQTDFGDVLGFDNKGAISVHAVSPEPFRLLEPEKEPKFCRNEEILLRWEESEDPDWCDQVVYHVLVDPDKANLEKNVTALRAQPMQEASTLIHEKTLATFYKLPMLEKAITYYWKVLAFDRAGNFYDPCEIRSFQRSEPDILIADLSFIPNNFLPALDAYDQGQIKVTIVNKSGCPTGKFTVTVVDSFPCAQGATKNTVLGSFQIGNMEVDSVAFIYFDWETREEGRHIFHAYADVHNEVIELDETNNNAECEAITIPRGKILANTDTLFTKQITFSACTVPIIPMVFFDSTETTVQPRYYQNITCEPPGILTMIADRLERNPDITLEVVGYVDPVSEAKSAPVLALKRAQNVFAILADSLGAAPAQLIIPDTQARIAHKDSIGRRFLQRAAIAMVNAENRRVELHIVNSTEDKERRLFGPENICINDALRDSLIFYSRLASFSGCSAWQLVLRDDRDKQVIRTMPFRLSRFATQQEDWLSWVGNDQFEKLIAVNSDYLFSMKVQDKLGRWFETVPQNIHIRADILNLQERYVFPMQFNKNIAIFDFYEKDIENLADKFIQDPSYHALVIGSTCPIGTLEANYKLVTWLKRSQSKFIEIVRDKLQKLYGADYSAARHLDPAIARIDTSTGGQYNLPAKNIAGLKGSIGPRLVYYSPCCCYHDILFGNDALPEGRNYNRRIEIVLYKEQKITTTAN